MKENDLIALGFTKEEFIPGNYDFTGIMDYDYVLEFKADENSMVWIQIAQFISF